MKRINAFFFFQEFPAAPFLESTLTRRSITIMIGSMVLLLFAASSFGQDVQREGGAALPLVLDEVVVTATRIEDAIRSVPKNITVITGNDIGRATSSNVVDLLAREANVNLRSFFGSDKWGGVDIRGMGDTFVSNVVVMVDGYRLNPPDLAGPDFSSVPLDQIERIEILRGAGSVLYGDGAVGGVINIITKKGERKPEVSLYSSYGSYDTCDGRISGRENVKGFGFNLNAGYYSSDGYRENGFLDKKDAGATLSYDPMDWLGFSLSAARHEDRYGLPGPVMKEDLKNRSERRKTARPEDSGETEDDRVRAGITLDLAHLGRFQVHRGYRFRDNRYLMGFNPLIPRAAQTDHIDEDTRMLDAGYVNAFELWGQEHRLQIGMDHFETDYVREELSRNQRKNSLVENTGFFITERWRIAERLYLHGGYRRHDFDGVFREDQLLTFGPEKRWVNGEPYDRSWTLHAWDTGAVLELSKEHSLFLNIATSFRSPNVDEFALAEENLGPQKGKHLEVGSRHLLFGKLEASATLFQLRIQDEIYYGEDRTGLAVNRNYDEETVRKGIELNAKFFARENITLWGNYAYTRARIDGKNTRVPLVPRYKASCGLEWGFFHSLVLALTATWVGDRMDGNDESNVLYDKLENYKVVDAKLTCRFKGLRVFAGVNNIFNELYSTVGYSETYYPMPERNYNAGAEWVF